MKMRTIQELKNYLTTRKLSPEQFAARTKVSNMTIRRMLKKDGSLPIPEKYHAQFDQALQNELLSKLTTQASSGGEEFGAFLNELEGEGRSVRDINRLQKDVDSKLKDPGIGQMIKDQVTLLLRSIRADGIPLRTKTIAIGTLLYLINPLDLIPDHLPAVGYIDDFAVLSLGVALVTGVLVAHENATKSGKPA